MSIPEGRKPLTDADMAALTHRLADTAIEQSELYKAAKRDAEEAEAYAAELEAAFSNMSREHDKRGDRMADLEAKLVKAVEALETIVDNGGAGSYHLARTTLAELKGQNDE